jgi:AcrR family transcriptional regulator
MFRNISTGGAPAQARSRGGGRGDDPRRRLLDAMVETVALYGYGSTTVARVLSAAGVDEAVFSEHFRDKNDCFGQALDELIEHGERAALDVFELDAPWAQRVRLGLERLLAALAGDPAAARVLLVEAAGAGAQANARLRIALCLLASLMEQGRAHSASASWLPAETSEAIVGGVVAILHQRALRGKLDELPGLHADLTYFALLPYLDHERALAVASG